MIRELTTPKAYDSVRQSMKRRCVSLLRHLEQSVPLESDVSALLRSDRRAQDAVYTLIAMSFSPELISTFVARERFTSSVVVDITASMVNRSLISLLKGIE